MNKVIFVVRHAVSFTVKDEDASKSLPRQSATWPEAKKPHRYVLNGERAPACNKMAAVDSRSV